MTTLTDIDDLLAAKAKLRIEMAERRRRAAAAAPPGAPLQARDRFLAAVPLHPGAVVSAFWPLPDEFDTKPLMFALHAAGHPIGLPVVQKRGLPLRFRLWTPETRLTRGNFNVEIHRQGYRLGYGGGFYDRTLATLRAAGATTAVGWAYAGQEIDAVPHDATDQPLDWVVTEREAIRIAR
jgi:5-formyltetrahydrofolate cyclo-ligase